ncbi:hypothetical protein [Adonisia turfae]|uniref:Uncharacterized protein n=1 Tax=Adonisia turfae CCMR0081 TaxID=2292702 RepID=A0A6M0RQW5_9CYAN|nr:hypothetical protein [Adonisia turfae]NEZ58637.1 hypothetical protein [Adonisia turfae CCMR0081]
MKSQQSKKFLIDDAIAPLPEISSTVSAYGNCRGGAVYFLRDYHNLAADGQHPLEGQHISLRTHS